jgi:hypothetical protein
MPTYAPPLQVTHERSFDKAIGAFLVPQTIITIHHWPLTLSILLENLFSDHQCWNSFNNLLTYTRRQRFLYIPSRTVAYCLIFCNIGRQIQMTTADAMTMCPRSMCPDPGPQTGAGRQ